MSFCNTVTVSCYCRQKELI